MFWNDVRTVVEWLQHHEPMMALMAALLSIAILAGCAITCCLAPTEKKDCLFHREVF